MSLKLFILSPHFDDAAYGLTLHIAGFIKSKLPLTIINCFTVTKWTAIPVNNKNVTTISLLRAKEDAAYNTLFNLAIRFINLNMLDAPLRNGYIFQFKPFEPNESELVEELENKLRDTIEMDESILLCPLGIGNHIDHAICREAVIKLYGKMKVLFYEDLPYAARITYDDIKNHIKELELRLNVKFRNNIYGLQNCTIDKELAIRQYKSQMNDDICREIIGHMHQLSGERLWGEAEILNQLKEKMLC